MTSLPTWLQLLQGLLTPTIAVAVGIIAFFQWRTAHSRLVFDLFEKRLAVYELVRKAVSVVNTHGKTNREAEIDLLEAIKAAEFLFGEDVRDYLDKMWERFLKLNAATAMIKGTSGENRRVQIEAQSMMFNEITQFYYEGSDVFAPYMRMEHRLRRPLKRLRQRPRMPKS